MPIYLNGGMDKKFVTIKKGGKHFLELCLKGVFGMAASKKSTPKSSQTKKRPSGSNKTETKQGKRTTTSTSQTKKQTPQQGEERKDFSQFYGEIFLLASIAVMLFFMLSNFSLCGKIGQAVSDTMFGLFGGIQYILPILVCLAIALLLSNDFSSLAIKKVILGVVAIICLSTLWQMIVEIDVAKLEDAYTYSAKHHIGGGYLGAMFSRLFYQYLGTFGAYVAIIALLLISFVLITERSFVSFVKESGEFVATNVKENSAVAKKSLDEIREQRKQKLANKKQIKKVFLEEERKNLVKDPELYKKTMVLPENATLPQKSPLLMDDREEKKEKNKPEIQKLTYHSDGINFDLNKMQGRTSEEKPKRREPNFHFLNDDIKEVKEDFFIKKEAEKKEVDTAIKKEQTVESKNTVGGWDFDSLPTEEELLLTGLEKGQKAVKKENPMLELSPERLNQKDEEEDSVEMPDMNGFVLKKATKVQSEPKKREVAANERVVSKRPIETKGQESDLMQKEAIEPIVKPVVPKKEYQFPPIDLLNRGTRNDNSDTKEELRSTALKLQQTLENFGVGVTITDVSQGPAVTRYELQPEQGVKVSKIVGLADDIKLNLAAADIRIEAPIPGKAAVGIEVPNKTNSTVMFRDLIENEEFKKFPSDIAFAVGKDIGGKTVVTDIAKMPHLLIAGATGSGKSVCINTLIMSILYKAKPSDVKMIMIDPKVVELSTYNGIPHLLIPVVTDPKKASSALNWAVMEMTDRYKKFAEYGVRNLKGYNKKVEEVLAQDDTREDGDLQKLPQIVIIVDELADLMMVAPGEVEDAIVRLSQLARAAGIHLVIATQRPSVNVITGLIKANVPSRIAFSVSSGVDSRTIIDMNGAEKLLGKGDMLFYPSGYQKPVRVQGAFISDEEVSEVVEFLKENAGEETGASTSAAIEEKINNATVMGGASSSEQDEYFIDAARFVIEKEKTSIGMLQRMFKIGFNRAARIMDQLSEAGIVGPEEGTKPRKVMMTFEEFEQYLEQ